MMCRALEQMRSGTRIANGPQIQCLYECQHDNKTQTDLLSTVDGPNVEKTKNKIVFFLLFFGIFITNVR